MEIQAIRTINTLKCKTGRINEYRRAFRDGLGASRKEETFDLSLGVRGGHNCCNSKVEWRHKINCKNSLKNSPDDLSDLKMPGIPIV